MPAREVEIVNRLGIHMRPAMQIVETCNRFRSRVTLYQGDQKVNGRSIMELMMMAAMQGTRLRLEAEGADAEACLDALSDLVKAKFNED